nr:hypothetical protein [Candidatus Electrothrix aestuarii]
MKQCSIVVEEFDWMALLLKYSQAGMVERGGGFVNGKCGGSGNMLRDYPKARQISLHLDEAFPPHLLC